MWGISFIWRKKSPETPPETVPVRAIFNAMATLAPAQSEYAAVTEGAGLLDRSERGKLALTGAQAKEFLQGQVTNDIEALAPGARCYAPFLTPKGKMLAD